MKIYIIILCLIIILLKYRISKKNMNKNKMIRLFNITYLPSILLVLTFTFYEDCLKLIENKTQTVFSNIYTEPADF